MSSFRNPTSAGTLDQQQMSALPMVQQKNRSQMEESSVRLEKMQRIMSADPSNQQRRATRAATALTKPTVQLNRMESLLSIIEKYKRIFEVIQINPRIQTNLQIVQAVISIGLIAIHPYHERWYISLFCMGQAGCSIAFLIYRLAIMPKKQPDPKKLAFLYLLYLLLSGVWTFLISVVFFVLQTEATFIQIRCCERSTYNGLDSCIDNKLVNMDTVPAEMAASCKEPWLWRDNFHKLNNISFTLIPFTVVQVRIIH
ncbi:hypothetical protein HDU67_003079 [Dinochytrium kinnereticum]|nr:hypothetical protein HDU67_003079 [Dinochytrium kinnereticum]